MLIARGESTMPLAPGLVRISGRAWAAGLVWALATDETNLGSEATRQAGRLNEKADFSYDLVCFRKGDVLQIGLGSRDLGHIPRKTPSLAHDVATLLGEDWLLCLALDDGRYWLCACSNGAIGFDSDRVVPNETEAVEAFVELLSMYGEGKLYVPLSWLPDYSGSIDSAAALVELGQPSKQAALYRLSSLAAVLAGGISVSPRTIMLVLLIFAVTGALGYGWWLATEDDRALEREAQARAGQIRRERIDEKPWVSMPLATDALRGCIASFAQMRVINVPGWELKRLSCALTGPRSSTTGHWAATWGHLGHAIDATRVRGQTILSGADARTFSMVIANNVPARRPTTGLWSGLALQPSR
jgi:hypothetical protein